MRPAVALLARDLEPSWSDPLVAALLGLRLPPPTDEDEDEEHPRRLLEGECRVIARRAQVPNNETTAAGDDISHEAVVEVASLRALELALTRNGLEVPMTHGYRFFNLSPLPPHAHVTCAAHVPGADPPLALQLAPLPTAEVRRRLRELIPPRADMSAPERPPKTGFEPGARAKGQTPKVCKVARHMSLVNALAEALGGSRPVVFCDGAPLVDGDASCADRRSAEAAVDALLAFLRRFSGWPTTVNQRKGVAAQNYLTLRRRDIDGFAKWLGLNDEGRGNSGQDEGGGGATSGKSTGRGGRSAVDMSEHEAAERAAAAEVVKLWNLSEAVLEKAVPDMAFDTLAVAKGFRGSPHIDHKDTTHQHVIALGNFEGGELCAEEVTASDKSTRGPHGRTGATDEGAAGGTGRSVESGARTLRINVKNRVARVDGRSVHWVSGWEGERYSIVYFSMNPRLGTPMRPSAEALAWMAERNKRVYCTA